MVSILMVSVPTVPILILMVDTTVTVSSLEPQATNTFLPLPPPTVSVKSTNDLLMLNTTVDTTAVDTDTDTDTVLDTVDTMVDTTAVDTDTVTDTDTTVNLNIKWL